MSTRPDPWSAPEEAAGQRLDRFLAGHFDVTRNRVQRWIRDGLVRVDGELPRASRLLRVGDRIECDPPPAPTEERVVPEPGPLSILHEDAERIVIDKPAGLTVHPGAGRSRGTLVHRLLHHFPELSGVGGPGRPGIVHRLDKDTSGVMVVARTDRSYRDLQQAFESRLTEKLYLGLGYGRAVPAAGRIELAIGRHPRHRKEMTVRADGRPALTEYRALGEAAGTSLFLLRLHTGRTHQIRVHLKAIRHPLVGDPVYGEERWKEVPPAHRRSLREFHRPALHAWRLTVPGGSGPPLSFTAPPPHDLIELWRSLSGGELAELITDQPSSPRNSA